MGHTPTNVIVNRDTSDSSIEASFTLNSRHVVRYQREGQFIQHLYLYVDESEISNATTAFLTYISWPFTIDRVDCVFTFSLLGTRASGKLEVGGTIVFTI